MSNDHDHDGWSAVPRSLDALVAGRADPQAPRPMKVTDVPLPSDKACIAAVTSHVRGALSEPAFNHSMRVFYYGQMIARQHFPQWRCSPETYLLACLLHDIGTTDANIGSTRLSFEFWGGMHALEFLKSHGASTSQAEAVAETIIRHQDVGDTGSISVLSAMIHFATLFDNVGGNAELVHPDSIKDVVAAWPRLKWTGCFAGVVRKEVKLKPWSHTTKIEGFAEKVEANELMKPYD